MLSRAVRRKTAEERRASLKRGGERESEKDEEYEEYEEYGVVRINTRTEKHA
jgi:hypothetical protein